MLYFEMVSDLKCYAFAQHILIYIHTQQIIEQFVGALVTMMIVLVQQYVWPPIDICIHMHSQTYNSYTRAQFRAYQHVGISIEDRSHTYTPSISRISSLSFTLCSLQICSHIKHIPTIIAILHCTHAQYTHSTAVMHAYIAAISV